ncbi:MAG: hypothetical protein HY590_02015 [Candidatus Omnitrophica bacterium]|nr:hypothetical protein [Candidatus Omnitrophota bacterium]
MEARQGDLTCPHCAKQIGKIDSLDTLFDRCALCQCLQFYLSKDFNQTLGCLVVAIGIALVPWTYGLSLPIFALIDWILYKRVPTIVNCYRCGSLFREFDIPKHLKPFSHPLAMQYERFRK